MLVSACSSLGGIELQEGAEGRFTAGDDGDPTAPDDDSSRPAETSDDDGGSDDRGDPGPLEPPPGTDGTGSTSDADDDGDTGTDTGTDDESSEGGVDDGTTSIDPQTNGLESGSGSTGDDGECTDLECLPVCDPEAYGVDEQGWPAVCGQQCDDVRDAAACVTEGGIVVSCDLGVWTCAE